MAKFNGNVSSIQGTRSLCDISSGPRVKPGEPWVRLTPGSPLGQAPVLSCVGGSWQVPGTFRLRRVDRLAGFLRTPGDTRHYIDWLMITWITMLSAFVLQHTPRLMPVTIHFFLMLGVNTTHTHFNGLPPFSIFEISRIFSLPLLCYYK